MVFDVAKHEFTNTEPLVRHEMPAEDPCKSMVKLAKETLDTSETTLTLIDWGSSIIETTTQMQDKRSSLQKMVKGSVTYTENKKEEGFGEIVLAVQRLNIGKTKEGHKEIAKLVLFALTGTTIDDRQLEPAVNNLDLVKSDAKLANALILGAGMLRTVDALMQEVKDNDGQPVFGNASRVFTVKGMWFPAMTDYTQDWAKPQPRVKENARPKDTAQPPTAPPRETAAAAAGSSDAAAGASAAAAGPSAAATGPSAAAEGPIAVATGMVDAVQGAFQDLQAGNLDSKKVTENLHGMMGSVQQVQDMWSSWSSQNVGKK